MDKYTYINMEFQAAEKAAVFLNLETGSIYELKYSLI